MWEWILGGGLVALVAAIVGVGWKRIEQHGEVKGDVRRAEEERDAANRAAERSRQPIETPEQRQRAARDELERRRSLRDSAGRS